MKIFTVKHESKRIDGDINLASSKSESNRALIINALCKGESKLSNLANARDTRTMQKLLSENPEILDVLDAGTTMRFLTAFSAVGGKPKILTGSKRMQERPIKLLVDALSTIGVQFTYEKNEGYPPFKIEGFTYNGNNKISISGEVSSQYISALLMVAPTLPDGLELTLTGKIGSKPYIQMTLNLMERFGASYNWDKNVIKVSAQKYTATDYTIEADWSGASYWYSMIALSQDGKVSLSGLRKASNQGDSVLVELGELFGVKTTFTDTGVLLEKCSHKDFFEWDFTHCPDIAQTVAVICAAKGISCKLTGLESLRIKETDRIEAIKLELAKFGVVVEVEGDEVIKIANPAFKIGLNVSVATYKDHRMAMAFAPLALLGDILVENPDVVDKSYPDYWRDLKAVGFSLG